jgi:butyryl-CoA dehydrogenase
MNNLSNKVAVITGAGSGIGKSLAIQLAREGTRLALNDWNAANLQQTLEEIQASGGNAWGKSFDVSQRDEVHRFAEETIQHFGQVDIVVNNAGITHEQRMLERCGYDTFEKILGVNLWGVIYGTKAFLPYLKQRPEAALVNISSIFGVIGYPNQGAYVTSKFAVRGFTETLRVELGDSPVTVTCVHPGGIRTNIVRNIESENRPQLDKFAKIFERMAITSADEAAAQIVEAIRTKNNRLVIGSDARKIDWLARLFPKAYERWVFKDRNFEKFSS